MKDRSCGCSKADADCVFIPSLRVGDREGGELPNVTFNVLVTMLAICDGARLHESGALDCDGTSIGIAVFLQQGSFAAGGGEESFPSRRGVQLERRFSSLPINIQESGRQNWRPPQSRPPQRSVSR
jgi:hypothetical protein